MFSGVQRTGLTRRCKGEDPTVARVLLPSSHHPPPPQSALPFAKQIMQGSGKRSHPKCSSKWGLGSSVGVSSGWIRRDDSRSLTEEDLLLRALEDYLSPLFTHQLGLGGTLQSRPVLCTPPPVPGLHLGQGKGGLRRGCLCGSCYKARRQKHHVQWLRASSGPRREGPAEGSAEKRRRRLTKTDPNPGEEREGGGRARAAAGGALEGAQGAKRTAALQPEQERQQQQRSKEAARCQPRREELKLPFIFG